MIMMMTIFSEDTKGQEKKNAKVNKELHSPISAGRGLQSKESFL